MGTIVEEASYNSCEASCRKGLELDPQSALLPTRLQALRDAGHPTDEAKDREMRDQKAAGECKAQGNAAFSAKRWKEAIDHYTKAMEQDPFDHVFCSNRSACYAESEEFEKALRDAERCIALNPQFAKGYSRQARKGLELDSSSVALQDLLKQAEIETRETPEVQAQMHKFRQEKKQDAKLQELMKGLDMQGNNIQMFNPGDDFSGLLNSLKGGGGGFPGMGVFGGSGKARMTEEQMRGMARAMSQASPSSTGAGYTSAPAETAKPEGPSSFAPQ